MGEIQRGWTLVWTEHAVWCSEIVLNLASYQLILVVLHVWVGWPVSDGMCCFVVLGLVRYALGRCLPIQLCSRRFTTLGFLH